jgi:hypothetical protein
MESPLSFNSTENFRKRLITKNLKPYKVDGFYSYSDQLPNSEIQFRDYSIIDSPPIEFYQDLKEPDLIGLNKYSQPGGFGVIVPINTNLNKFSNFGEYKPTSAINSELEIKGDTQENLLRVLNKYNPENISVGFGDSFSFELKTLGSNHGEYDYFASAPNITTEQSQVIAYVANVYGPENQPNGFGSEVDININKQTRTNVGSYDYLDSPPERTTEQSRIISYVSNQYGPENKPNGYGVESKNPNINQNTITNQGEYDYTASRPTRTNQQQQSAAYIKNKYNTGDGSYELYSIDDFAQETLNKPYLYSESTFAFTPSEYSVVNLIQDENPSGSDGSLSQDSLLAQLGAKQIQKEFKARMAYELLQQTVGRTNLFTGEIDNDGRTSIRQNNDPFNALGIITNNIPIVQKNYKITGGPTAVANALNFTSRLAGLYSPYSLIPGEYFDYPNKNFLSQAASNPVGAAAGLIGNLAQQITTLFIESASEQFLNYTSDATKSLLFDQLFYNNYRPAYRFAGLSASNLLAPKGSFYVGKTKSHIRDIVSPKVDLPKGRYNKPQEGPVYGYGEVGKDYEGNQLSDYLFGLNSRSLFDSVDVQGGFTWLSKNNYIEPGTFVGPGNKKDILSKFNTDSLFTASSFKPLFDKTKSTNLNFTDGSILDITQKLIDAGNRSTRKLEHVGNAINQVSKVFNDGYIELTKGSRVVRYVTPNSLKPNKEKPEVKGYEYCRLFTKDRPYYTYNELQKTDGNIRKSKYSVLDNTYNLNIAPMRGQGSTNIKKDGTVKKYMFSIENLAWRTSNRKGYRVEDLPACEKGPNGGRIMWFPPYDLTFNDTSTPEFQSNTFLGRPEPIYTYKNTNRIGTISWSMIVDHPSIMNLLLDKELQNVKENSEITKIVDSFIAGCLKYDIYDLLKKYREFTLSDIGEVIDSLNTIEQYKEFFKENTNASVDASKSIDKSGDLKTSSSQGSENLQENDAFKEILLLFDELIPKDSGFSDSATYETYYTEYTSDDNKKLYLGDPATNLASGAPDKIIKYGSKSSGNNNDFTDTLPNDTESFSYSEYVDARVSSVTDVFSFFEDEFTTLKDQFLPQILAVLKQGKTVKFKIEGSANSGESGIGTASLDERRVKTVDNYIQNFESGGDKIKTYIDNGQLKYTAKSNGSSATIDELKYKDIDCSKKFNVDSSYDGKFSVQAMVCRRVKIYGLDVQEGVGGKKKDEVINEGTGVDEKGGEENSTTTPPSAQIKGQMVVTTEIKDKTNKIREGLTKRLLRRLLTECNYFDMVQEQQPMVYDGIKSKFKNFQPAFHSITPEGLNGRLTFLQQCVRPGDTIPTAVDNGQGGYKLQYQDAFNSAFGSPPVLVLRIGDFFHTKVIPGALSITFDDLKFDLNPEGIGVQPMRATVSLPIKIIGGMGLKEPISKLQNALTFNYYANTEMYDERADVTENFTSDLDAELLKDIQEEAGVIDPNRPRTNDGGDTIGTIETTNVDPAANSISGGINYKEVMNQLITQTSDMVSNFNQSIVELATYRGWSALIIFTKDRKYSEGLFRYLNGNVSNKVNIIGKAVNYQEKIDDLFTKIEQDVDDETIPLLGNLNQKTEFTKEETRKIKRKLKELIGKEKSVWQTSLDNATNKIVKNELIFIKATDKINYVVNGFDGRINNKGGVNVYGITGTTPVDISSVGATDTMDELQKDFNKIRTDLNEYDQLLKKYQLIPNGDKNVYNTDYLFNLYLVNNVNSTTDDSDVSVFDRRFAMVFSPTILTSYESFIDDLVSVIDDTLKRGEWKSFIYKNLGFNIDFSVTIVSPSPTGLFNKMKNSQTILDKTLLDKYRNDDTWKKFFGTEGNAQYKPYNKDKLRKFNYQSQIPVVPPNDTNLRDIWSTVDSTWDYFNGKRTMS